MTRESYGIGISRLVALAFALVATAAVALAIPPGTALAATNGPTTAVSPSGAGDVDSNLDESGYTFTARPAEGYEFVNWTFSDGHGYSYTSSKNPSERTKWDEPEDATVTANFRSTGPTPPTAAVDPSSAGTVAATVIEGGFSYTATANEGWEFVKWNIVFSEGAAENYANPLKVDSNVQAVTAYFKEKETPATTYKISVSADPTTGGTATVDKQEAAAGDTVKLTATPADRSWEFVEWKTDPAVTITDDAFTMPSSNVSVTAVFKKASTSTYAITFNANGGTGSMDKLAAEEGATVTLTANAFTRSGYTFTGWNTAKDGSGTAYEDKASVKVEGDMTLYAQWKANSSTATSKSTDKADKVAKTGDTAIPMTAVAVITALAVGVMLVARRKMA